MKWLTLLISTQVFVITVQAQTGTISGTITDASGAGVPSATVTLTNLGTAATRTATTDNSGTYSIPQVPVGRYDATVEARGFSNLRFTNVELTVGQALTLSGTLQLGQVSQQIEVIGAAAAINHEDAQISNIVDQRRIQELPLITRDPYQLVLLSPGTQQTTSRMGGFSVNGQRERNNNFLLDGTDNNDASVPGGPTGASGINPDSGLSSNVVA